MDRRRGHRVLRDADPKRQDILNAKSTRPRGSRLHEYRDLAGELKQTMRQLKDKEEDL